MVRKLTKAEFIDRAKETHGNRYDYSQANYINATTEVRIICRKHGAFLQQPTLHYKGTGCEQCCLDDIANTKRLRYEKEFLVKAKKKYGEKYSYSKLHYEHSGKKVVITCPTHGNFSVSPANFLKPNYYTECIFCARQERFIQKATLVQKSTLPESQNPTRLSTSWQHHQQPSW